jgi:acetyltransferase-like isoleucine patch superfamily enzyme
MSTAPQANPFLAWLDQALYSWLQGCVERMPMRGVKFLANFYPDARIRKLYWRRLGISMGENTYGNLGMRIASNDQEQRVVIGKNVSIAPNVTFVVYSSAVNGQELNALPYVRDVLTRTGKIVVEDEAWIGASVTILPGVTIGRCAVVGAGSVVTSDVEPYSIYAGTPARKIRDLRTGERV